MLIDYLAMVRGAAVTTTSGMYEARQYLELSDNQTDTQTILSKLQKR